MQHSDGYHDNDSGKDIVVVIFEAVWWRIETVTASQNPSDFTGASARFP